MPRTQPEKFALNTELPNTNKYTRYLYITSGLTILLLLLIITNGCQSIKKTASSDTANYIQNPSSDLNMMVDPCAFTSEPWKYNDEPGSIIITKHYRIMTTLSDPGFVRYIPFFLENTLNKYTTVLADLPLPTKYMDTYLFGNRNQWISYTKKIMGKNAAPYLNIGRGGFSMNGVGVFYDLGRNDTLTIAAHEGWHQFTQGTMRERLPIWLEEGIATYMEGNQLLSNTTNNSSRNLYYQSRYDKDNYEINENDEIVFLPWLNQERTYQLRRAAYRRQLFTLEQLLNSHPEKLLSQSRTKTLNYYSQLWALIHFLREEENGKYRNAFKKLLLDARYNRMRIFVTQQKKKYGKYWLISTSPTTKSINSRKEINLQIGPDVFLAYFNRDLDEVNTAYQAFISKLITRDARWIMSKGLSPIQQIDTPDKESTP